MINWRELQQKFPKGIETFIEFVKQQHGNETIWHYTSNTELYRFFDSRGIILVIDFTPQSDKQFSSIVWTSNEKIKENLHFLSYYSERPLAEQEGFKKCFEVLDVQLNE